MPISRRRFIRTATYSSAVAFSIPGIAPSAFARVPARRADLRFGAIGVNGMGFSNVRSFVRQNLASCVALCDVDSNVLSRRSKDVIDLGGSVPDTYADYRALLDRDDLDFVVIGTPDHWHPLMMIDAVSTGKHVYVEKPLANSIGECDAMQNAAHRSDRLVQLGQWQRSGPHWRDAVAFVHSGALGNIRTVKTWAYQGWMKPVPVLADGAPPEGVDYDRWLGPAPSRAFNRNRFHFNFRWFWDYAGGLMTDWGVHILDYALYGMNAGYPKSVMALGGKMAYPDDASETPDTLQAVYDFGDFTLLWEHATGIDLGPYRRTHGVAFIGNNGTLVVDRGGWEVIPESERNEAGEDQNLVEVPSIPQYDGSDLDRHTSNFVDAIENGAELTADIDVGHKVAVVAHMGNVAYKTGRRIYWDQNNKAFIDDDDANALRLPTYRAPWELPAR